MNTLTGRVRLSTGEGFPGALVSDGRAVRRTGPDGGFELPGAGGSGFVSVTRPTGYAAATWFHRVTGEADGYDFSLEPAEQPVPFSFAQVTDLHLCVESEPTRLPVLNNSPGLGVAGSEVRHPICPPEDVSALLEELSGLPTPDGRGVAFVAVTGDLTHRGIPAEYGALGEVLSASSIPVEVLPGNHDHYGHRYEPRPDDRPVDSFGMSTGTTTRYEEGVGLRWWSMDHGGVHFAAIDWFGHRLGTDRDVQEEWLRADLAAQPPGTPVVLLVHDHMESGFFQWLRRAASHVRLLGSFSGHWHMCRTMMEGGEIHASTGNATFGSCDFTAPQYRLCTWDGTDLKVRTVTRGGPIPSPEAGARATARPLARRSVPGEVWAARLPGAAHMARPVVASLPVDGEVRGMVFAAWGNEEDPEGGMLALDATTGEEVWRARVASTVRAGAAYAPGGDGSSGVVVVVSVSGEVLALDALSGEDLWRRRVGDPLRMWVYGEPLIHEGLVFVGDVGVFGALDLSTGEVAWKRGDLGVPENHIPVAHPAIQAGTLLAGFMDQSPNTWGLDPRTGETRWSSGDEPLLAPMTEFVPDPDGEHAYTIRFGGLVEKLCALSGERRWKAEVDAIFTPGRPAPTPDATGLIATSGTGTVHRLDRATGEVVWRTGLPDEALLSMGPYRKSGSVVVSGPTVTGRGILQATCGGMVYRIDPTSGEATVVTRLDAPVAAPLAPVGDDVVAVTTDGTVRRLGVA